MSRTAILTRPDSRNATLAGRLHAQGWAVLCAPALTLRGVAFSTIDHRPDQYDLMVFVSGSAVRFYCDGRQDGSNKVAWPSHVAVAGVGAATLRVIRERLDLSEDTPVLGPAADAQSFDSEALYETILRTGQRFQRVLIIRATHGRDWLAARFRADGATVDTLAVYVRTPVVWPQSTWDTLDVWATSQRKVTWLYTSAEGLQGVAAQMTQSSAAAWWAGSDAVVTHSKLVSDWQHATALAGRSVPSMVKVCLPDDDAIFEAFVAL